MKKVLLLSLIVLVVLPLPAQDSLYVDSLYEQSLFEQMKAGMDGHSLPLVNLTVDAAKLNRFSFVPGEIEIADYQRRTDPSSDSVRYRCLLRIRGQKAALCDKKSFAVKLVDEESENLDAPLFGIRSENSWILDAMAIDRIRMRNRLCFDIWNELSNTPYTTRYGNRNGTLGQFVEVFINGDYNGLYCLTDKIDRRLLGLKKAKADSTGVTVRGLLYKGISHESSHDLLSYDEDDMTQDTWNAWELQYPDDYPSADTWEPLAALIDFCSPATSDEVFHEEYQDYFYPGNLADYHLLTVALNVVDNAYKNTFLSVVDIGREHRYLLTPWDMDGSLGSTYNGSYDETLSWIYRYQEIAPYNRLFSQRQSMDGFKGAVAERWFELCPTLFSVDSICRRLDDYAHMFVASGAWARERGKWDGNPVPLKEDIMEELDYVKGWYARNFESICNQFERVRVSVSSPSATRHTPSPIFDLQGRRLSGKPQKGVYIQDGKKRVVK